MELHSWQPIPRTVGTSIATASPKRILRDLLLGACLGGIGAALVWHFYPGFWREPPVAAHEIALQRRQAFQEEAQQQAARATLAAVQPVPQPLLCDLEPLIPPSGAQDGNASVEHPFPGGPRARARVFLRQAEAATARGRLRDAEIALLAACRENDEASATPTVPLARVLGMLGDRYAAAAGAENSPFLREQLVARARQVMSHSAQAYATALGPNASRSRQARQRLAGLEQDLVAATDVPQARADRLQDASVPARLEPAARVGVAPAAKPVAVRRGSTEPERVKRRAVPDPVTQRPDPQPVQNRASLEEPPDLRQLASDLARLRAQAEAVSDDPAGFRRRARMAQAQRDQCLDAACLREWYRRRRRELLTEF